MGGSHPLFFGKPCSGPGQGRCPKPGFLLISSCLSTVHLKSRNQAVRDDMEDSIFECAPSLQAREDRLKALVKSYQASFIPPIRPL